MQNVILVDKNDNELGVCEKITAHKEKRLHRAFSVFLFNEKKELLIQKRASNKYHSGNLWSNSCCSHQQLGNTIEEDVINCVKKELGASCDNIKRIFDFIYEADLVDMYEYEYDYVIFANVKGNINPNPDEVQEVKWVDMENLKIDINLNSEKYTAWFKAILKEKNFLINKLH